MGAITKRQVAALTIGYAIVRGVVEKVKPESPAEEANIDNVAFNQLMSTVKCCCDKIKGEN